MQADAALVEEEDVVGLDVAVDDALTVGVDQGQEQLPGQLQPGLQRQRAYYSESAITDVEAALSKIIGKLEQLSTQDNAPQLIGSLLKKFDVVTGLSAWSDPKHLH